MTKKEIIDGLQFTIDMFLSDPLTGEALEKPRNDMDKTTIDACKGAIELLEQQPCEDAISRAETLKTINNMDIPEDMSVFEIKSHIGVEIGTLPPVQPKPKTGHWIIRDDLATVRYYQCSECNEIDLEDSDYCPNCGAKMVEPQESEDKE